MEVSVDSDLPIPSAMDRVVLLVETVDGSIIDSREFFLSSREDVPLVFSILQKSEPSVRIRAHAFLGERATPVQSLQTEVSFVSGQSVPVRLVFVRSCPEFACENGDVCQGERCVTPGEDAGTIDAADGGVRSCGPGCDDELPCNGVERCVDDRCVAGTPVTCESVGCQGFLCSEDTGACEPSPGTVCNETQACIDDTCQEVVCREDPCQFVEPQCGCPSGQDCLTPDFETTLCGNAGDLAAGATCEVRTGCGRGMICVNREGGVTVPYCALGCTSDDACPGRATCTVLASTSLSLCSAGCNLGVPDDGCLDGSTCVYVRASAPGRSTDFGTVCLRDTEVGIERGGSCTVDAGCRPPFACWNERCTSTCQNDGACEAMERCDLETATFEADGISYSFCTPAP